MRELALIFTGHMIDAPDRSKPRFPKHLEQAAAEVIHDYVKGRQTETEGNLVCISSGACGGDILFIEACRECGIENYLFLPFSHEEFLKSSVNISQEGNWEERFLDIWNGLEETHKEIIEPDSELNIYDACNVRMLNFGQEIGKQVDLVALWDGVAPEKPGGTADFVRRVKEQNGQVHQIAPDQLGRLNL